MKILLIEPFFTGSHKQWACAYQQCSQHNVDILSLPGRHWKWRMHGAAVSLANQFNQLEEKPDFILASSMFDLTTFMSLTRGNIEGIKIALYFHENQITYPWSPRDEDVKLRRDNHYGFINYTSALAADRVFFNSKYHLESFIGSLPEFLKQFPDHQELQNVGIIQDKSQVLHLGMDLKTFDQFYCEANNEVPILLWNHRWEYDKNPEGFYKALCFLRAENLDFRLVVLGESYKQSPKIFATIQQEFSKELLHFGYAEGFETYAHWLWKSDILAVTSNQDFFGGSVVEAIYCGCFPLLPDRLSYKEHIPDELIQNHFYSSEEKFHQQLKQQILNYQSNKKNQALSDFVGRYDWSILAAIYDEQFENCRS